MDLLLTNAETWLGMINLANSAFLHHIGFPGQEGQPYRFTPIKIYKDGEFKIEIDFRGENQPNLTYRKIVRAVQLINDDIQRRNRLGIGVGCVCIFAP